MKPWRSKVLRKFTTWTIAISLSVGLYVMPRIAYADGNSGSAPASSSSTTSVQNAFGNPVDPSTVPDLPPAGVVTEATPTSSGSSGKSTVTDNTYDNDPDVQAEYNNAGFVDKMIGGLVSGLAFGILKIGNFVPIDQLAFGTDAGSLQVFATTTDGKSEFDAISPVYWGFFTLVSVLMIVNVIRYGLKIASQGSNPRSRATIGSMAVDFLIGFFLLTFSWFIVYYASDWNLALCQWIQPYKINPADSTLSSMKVMTGDYLTSELVRFVLIGMSVFFNILYALRKFLLIGFVLIGPFVALAYAGGNKEAFSVWLSETLTNAFMPFSHALVLAMYFRLNAWSNTTHVGMMSKWWVPIVTLFFLVPVSQLFRRMFGSLLGQLLGINEELTAAASGLAGLAGLSGVSSMASSLVGGTAKGAGKAMGAFAGGSGAPGNMMAQGGGSSPSGGGDGPSGGAGIGMPSAGAVERGNAPSAIQTGIGQASPASVSAASGGFNMPKGISTVQSAIGKGRSIGAGVAGTVGKAVGATAGAALDMGALAMGQRTNFRQMGARVGGSVGESVGGAFGGNVGTVVGREKAIRQEQANARETGTTRSEQNISRSTALNRAMGFDQRQNNGMNQGVGRQERTIQEKNARRVYRTTVATAGLNQNVANVANRATTFVANRSISKGLEKIGNLKER